MVIIFDEVHRGLSKFVNKQTGSRMIEIKYKIRDFHSHPIDTVERRKRSWRYDIIETLQKSFMKANRNHDDFLYRTGAIYYTKKLSRRGELEILPINNDNSYRQTMMDTLDNLDFMVFDSIDELYVNNFYVYIAKKPTTSRSRVGHDDHNDCLYNALAMAVNFDIDRLPKRINKAWKLKKHFGYDRDDMVDVKHVLPELRNLFKYHSINVIGDYENIQESKQYNITLKVKGGHIKNVNSKEFNYQYYCNTGKILMYKFKYDDETVETYDGETYITIDMKDYESKVKKNYGYVKCKCESDDNLKDKYAEYIKMADHFKAENKMIDFYSSPIVSHVSFKLWYNLTKDLKTPDKILEIEQSPLSQSNRGGLHYGKRPTDDGRYYEYDMTNFYLSMMQNPKFTFPSKQPDTVRYMSTKDLFELKYIPYGIYKSKITGHSIYIPKSMCDTYQWHNNYSLQIAQLEGLTIEMYDEDEAANCLLYTKERVNGSIAFKKYAEIVNGIKERNRGKEYYDRSKLLCTSLWGSLCEKNKTIKIHDNADDIIVNSIEDFNTIKKIIYTKNKTIIKKSVIGDKLFKTDYCRVGTFLTGFCRLQLYKIMKEQFKNDDIKYINTDGFVVTKKLDEKYLGTEIGKFKQII